MSDAHSDETRSVTVEESLRRVVDGYGHHALTDPVALRSALRACGTELAPEDVEVLVTVAGSGTLDGLRSARTRGAGPEAALDRAVRETQTRTGMAPGRTRWACRGLATALGLLDDPPSAPDQPERALPDAASAQHRVSWEELTGAHGSGTRPISEPVHPPPSTRRPRRAWLLVAAASALLAAAVVAAIALAPGRPAPAPDRYAVDQVAQRYRALGANLLTGAVRCAAVAPDPGELERVDCSFGGSSVILVGYDTPSG